MSVTPVYLLERKKLSHTPQKSFISQCGSVLTRPFYIGKPGLTSPAVTGLISFDFLTYKIQNTYICVFLTVYGLHKVYLLCLGLMLDIQVEDHP